jgi:hypothetical protein
LLILISFIGIPTHLLLLSRLESLVGLPMRSRNQAVE